MKFFNNFILFLIIVSVLIIFLFLGYYLAYNYEQSLGGYYLQAFGVVLSYMKKLREYFN
jgi:hypothetical protein